MHITTKTQSLDHLKNARYLLINQPRKEHGDWEYIAALDKIITWLEKVEAGVA